MAHDINKELKVYKAIYFALLVLTAITVGVSYIPSSVAVAIIIALVVASFKASLVAGFFMHLREEKPIILYLFGFTLFFFISMIALIVIGQYDLFEGSYYIVENTAQESSHHASADMHKGDLHVAH